MFLPRIQRAFKIKSWKYASEIFRTSGQATYIPRCVSSIGFQEIERGTSQRNQLAASWIAILLVTMAVESTIRPAFVDCFCCHQMGLSEPLLDELHSLLSIYMVCSSSTLAEAPMEYLSRYLLVFCNCAYLLHLSTYSNNTFSWNYALAALLLCPLIDSLDFQS